jgi:hypothetical protein
MRRELTALAALALFAAGAPAQGALLGARAVDRRVSLKIFNPAGSVRIIAWDKDSVVVRGTIAHGEHFYLSGDRLGLKTGVMDHRDGNDAKPCTLIISVPRGSTVSVKSPIGDIDGDGVTGWFFTASGRIRLKGTSRSIEVESVGGDIAISVTAPMVRAKTGDGRLMLSGEPEDVDLSTIGGSLSVRTSNNIVRGRFSSVTGDIEFRGDPVAGGILDFTDHSGSVTLTMSEKVSGVFDLSSILGTIDNEFNTVRPAALPTGTGLALRLTLGDRAAAGRVTVRTFKGQIKLVPER